MIEATQTKLQEAHFFYRRLDNERQQPTLSEPGAFRHYFSAFLSAARSVPWRLKNEEKEKYLAWEPTWKEKLTTDERKLLDITNELRLDEAKRAGANILVEWEEESALQKLLGRNFDLERQHPAYGVHSSSMIGVPSPKAGREAYYLEHEDGKTEVMAMCEQYLDYLEKMVQDFCHAHP
jgi:hypothetical protein